MYLNEGRILTKMKITWCHNVNSSQNQGATTDQNRGLDEVILNRIIPRWAKWRRVVSVEAKCHLRTLLSDIAKPTYLHGIR